VLAVFYWKRTTTAGAIVSIAVGTVITVAWNMLKIESLDAVYPALTMSVLCLIVVSMLTHPPDPSKIRPFFETEQ
jgi:SSS family solute:Na+ symporter/sodium/proline symporter